MNFSKGLGGGGEGVDEFNFGDERLVVVVSATAAYFWM